RRRHLEHLRVGRMVGPQPRPLLMYDTAPPELLAQRPTPMQLARIRDLSQAVLGDRHVFLAETGQPFSRGDAAYMLAAFDAYRSNRSDPRPEVARHVETIRSLKQGGGPMPVAEEPTKTCSRCHQQKPLDGFHKNRARKDGVNPWCKDCVRDHYRAGRSSTKTAPVPARDHAREPSPTPPPADPAVASRDDDPSDPVTGGGDRWAEQWKARFANPTLNDLRALAGFLGGVTLDEAAAVCVEICGASDDS
ncbi:MAG: hypothetical protein L0Z49_04575, partial [Actinobacteria bacterium]|nr:hypothetical protein [Actinomycetota bacterium]